MRSFPAPSWSARSTSRTQSLLGIAQRRGAQYGLLVYLFMNYVVIPVSAATPSRFLASWVICSVVVHMLLVGVPAALFARAATPGKEHQHG